MAVVTALRAARRGRVAVHADGEYLCTVSEALVARRHLFKGLELGDDDVAELKRAASAEVIAADAFRLLGHRARSRAELERRLLDKGHDEATVATLLERLVADGLVDDAAFARSYVADKRKLAGWGEGRIRRGLAALGVAPAVIDGALAAAPGGDAAGAELERALAVLRKLGPPRPPLEAARRRAYQALQRRGFSGETAYAAVRRWSAGAPPGDPSVD